MHTAAFQVVTTRHIERHSASYSTAHLRRPDLGLHQQCKSLCMYTVVILRACFLIVQRPQDNGSCLCNAYLFDLFALLQMLSSIQLLLLLATLYNHFPRATEQELQLMQVCETIVQTGAPKKGNSNERAYSSSNRVRCESSWMSSH